MSLYRHLLTEFHDFFRPLRHHNLLNLAHLSETALDTISPQPILSMPSDVRFRLTPGPIFILFLVSFLSLYHPLPYTWGFSKYLGPKYRNPKCYPIVKI